MPYTVKLPPRRDSSDVQGVSPILKKPVIPVISGDAVSAISDLIPGPPAPIRRRGAPWPETLPPFGRRTVGPFEQCVLCGAGTWGCYGRAPLCLDHALAVESWTPAITEFWALLDELRSLVDDAPEPHVSALLDREKAFEALFGDTLAGLIVSAFRTSQTRP